MSGRSARQQSPFGMARSAISLQSDGSAPAFEPEDVELSLFVGTESTKVTVPKSQKGAIRVRTRQGPKLDRSPVLLSLDYGVEDASTSETAGMTATMSLQRPDASDPESLGVDIGDQIGLDVDYRGKTYTGFRMRAATPSIALPDGTVDFELIDPYSPITKIVDHWTYRKSKNRPSGWTCDQIVRDACEKHGVPVGTLMRGHLHIHSYKSYESLMALAIAVYAREFNKTGRDATFRIRGGRLEIVAKQRNRVAYVLDGAAIVSANVSVQGFPGTSAEGQGATPVTVIDARGHSGKNRGRRAHRAVVSDQRALNRFGYVRVRKEYGKVDGDADLRERAKRTLAYRLRLIRTAEVVCAYLPFVDVPDAVVIKADIDQDFGGEDRVAFVSAFRHQISADSRQTTLSLKEQDDFLTYRLLLEKKRRAQKRRERAKK